MYCVLTFVFTYRIVMLNVIKHLTDAVCEVPVGVCSRNCRTGRVRVLQRSLGSELRLLLY
jgi:hypothetical protein